MPPSIPFTLLWQPTRQIRTVERELRWFLEAKVHEPIELILLLQCLSPPSTACLLQAANLALCRSTPSIHNGLMGFRKSETSDIAQNCNHISSWLFGVLHFRLIHEASDENFEEDTGQ
jgi:hypothetical protein